MSFFAKQRILYYKRFKVDIWGIFKNSLQWREDKSNYYCSYLRSKYGSVKFLSQVKTLDYYTQLRNRLKSYKHLTMKQKVSLLNLNKKITLNLKKFETRKRRYNPNLNKYMTLRNLNKIKLQAIIYHNILYKAFKTKISKKVGKVFSFFFNRKAKREKFYFYSPFVYEVREKKRERKIYYTESQFASLRVTRLFYILYTYRQLKKLCKKAKRKDGVFEQTYMWLMECKLPSFIYRTSFMSNMFESISFIKDSNVWINKQFIPFIYYTVDIMDIVGIRVIHKSFIYWTFFKRLRRRAFIFLLPEYIYTSLIFFWFILLRIPKKEDIINALSVDMYRLANYAV